MYLATGETNRNDTQVVTGGKKLGLQSGCVGHFGIGSEESEKKMARWLKEGVWAGCRLECRERIWNEEIGLRWTGGYLCPFAGRTGVPSYLFSFT